MNEPKQRELPFGQPKESKLERCNRILSGKLGHKLRRASELLHFNYETATAIARRSQPTPRRSQ